MADRHQKKRLADIAALLASEQYSDLQIICEGRVFKVHKNIMASASSVIAGALDSKMQEGETGVIRHDEYDAVTVERMISYVYTQGYTVKKDGPDVDSENKLSTSDTNPTGGVDSDLATHANALMIGEVPFAPNFGQESGESVLTIQDTQIGQNVNLELIAHARVFAIADYYYLPELKCLALDNFKAAAKLDWNLEGFIEVVKEVNKLTGSKDRELRDALRSAAMEHITELTRNDEFMTEIAELEEAQDFAADMLRSVVKRHDAVRAFHSECVRNAREVSESLIDRVKVLEAELAEQRRLVDLKDVRGDEIGDSAREAIEKLQHHIENLPSDCRNANCSREFGGVYFEHKGQMARGGFYTDWWVKCDRCKCKLNKS